MSTPPTEALEISDDSLFSDSSLLDAIETLPKPESEDQRLQTLKPKKGFHMKPRKNETTTMCRWEPVSLKVPDDDPDDELDIGSANNPIYEYDDDDLAAMRNGEPDFRGDIMNCFDEPGLLYRVFNKELKTWAFYNDSVLCEIHVSTTFGKFSKVIPLESTTIQHNAEGEIEANVVVYPGETEMFVKGYINGYKSKLMALPLSEEYFAARSEAQWKAVIQPEIDAIRAVVGNETDSEVVLQACLEHNLHFVDLSFPPTPDSFQCNGHKKFPWARPAMYLRPEQRDQIRLFRNEITLSRVILGDLGNCWMICALATVAENPNAIFAMFRHPKGAKQGRRERAVGAYRVTFNKNGLWRSVLVDDYFPVIASTPQIARSSDPCELWPSLLEKAFAKLHGCYDRIESGDPVHAITDLTGAPSLRIDDDLDDAAAGGDGRELLARLRRFTAEGYRILFTTPGNAPAVLPGTLSVPDLSEDPELEDKLAGTSLLPGHAYTVLQVVSHPRRAIHLFKIRNPWLWGSDRRCKWSRSSPLWDEHGDIAREVGFDAEDCSVLWLTWEEVLEYFSGGGVVFTPKRASELRIPITFCCSKPSVVLEIWVTEPIKMWMMLSNIDNRVIQRKSAKLEDYVNSSNYPPIMLSLASADSANPNLYRIQFNTTRDPIQPSPNKWTFLQAREIAMLCELTPSKLPYLLVPRLMEGDITEVCLQDVGDYRNIVIPEHFANTCEQLCPETGMANVPEIPMTLGLRVEGSFDSCQVALRNLPSKNAVFGNFPKFNTELIKKPAGKGVLFQIKSPDQGFAVQGRSNDILKCNFNA